MVQTQQKVGLGVLVDKDLRKQVRRILLDEGISVTKWLNGVLQQLVEQHQQLQAHQPVMPQKKYVKHDLQEK